MRYAATVRIRFALGPVTDLQADVQIIDDDGEREFDAAAVLDEVRAELAEHEPEMLAELPADAECLEVISDHIREAFVPLYDRDLCDGRAA